MGKYYSITCPVCGRKIRKKVGYGVEEFRRTTEEGRQAENSESDVLLPCPGCGRLIDPENEPSLGKDDFVAFFD